jgi:hypothetical protein
MIRRLNARKNKNLPNENCYLYDKKTGEKFLRRSNITFCQIPHLHIGIRNFWRKNFTIGRWNKASIFKNSKYEWFLHKKSYPKVINTKIII